MTGGEPRRSYKYYDLIMAGFVTVLICSNFISAAKPVTVGGFTFGAGVLFFPISYLFGDILTEVYGYARSRKVVWAGFGAITFTSLVSWVVVHLPPAAGWPNQPAYEAVFGGAPRVVAASMMAFFTGEFVNSYAMARLKVLSQGRFLWARTIGSTVVGEAADSLIFYPRRLPGGLGPAAANPGVGRELHPQGRLGGRRHALDVRRGRLPEAGRGGGPLRRRHELHAVLAGDVRRPSHAHRED